MKSIFQSISWKSLQGQLRNYHLAIPCPRLAIKSLLCRNATIYRASSPHLLDSVFMIRMVGVFSYHPHSLSQEIVSPRSWLKTQPVGRKSAWEPMFSDSRALLFVCTILPFSILLSVCYTNESRTVLSLQQRWLLADLIVPLGTAQYNGENCEHEVSLWEFKSQLHHLLSLGR